MHEQGEQQTLTLSFGVGSVHAWMIQSQMTGVQQQQMQLGLQSDREAFMFKRILLETNPIMLAFSTLFILCHSIFSFFAFKNGETSVCLVGTSPVSLLAVARGCGCS